MQLNSPREMWCRLMFVATLLLGGGGLVFTAIGFFTLAKAENPWVMLSGLAAFALSRALYAVGQRRWDFDRLEKQIDHDTSGKSVVYDPEFEKKLREFEEAEEELLKYQEHYQEANYDINHVQRLRQKVRDLIKEDERLQARLRPDIVL